jgi:hypothetical protein
MNFVNIISNKKKSGRKKDIVRDKYTITDSKFICNYEKCNKIFSSKTSITSLKSILSV